MTASLLNSEVDSQDSTCLLCPQKWRLTRRIAHCAFPGYGEDFVNLDNKRTGKSAASALTAALLHAGCRCEQLGLTPRRCPQPPAGQRLYLHEKWTRVPKAAAEETANPAEPTKMAIGVEARSVLCAQTRQDLPQSRFALRRLFSPAGRLLSCVITRALICSLLQGGFNVDEKKYDIVKEHAIVLIPER